MNEKKRIKFVFQTIVNIIIYFILDKGTFPGPLSVIM